jgi:membrane protein DedA with SNARE-associated domain/rhodanese-related sulfurtransferase
VNHLIMLLQQYGLGLVFANVLALQAGLPVPAYPTLIVAGAYAAMGGTPLSQLAAVGVAAALVADTGWYVAGRFFGGRVLGVVCRVSLSPGSCVRETERIFRRFGPASMLVAKFVPGFASVATALAGTLRLSYWKFVAFDAAGAALWSGVAIGLGYAFSDAIESLMKKLAALGQYGLLLIIAAFAAWILLKSWRRYRFIKQLRVDRVSVGELHRLIQEKKPVALVDIRSGITQAATGRIPGARAIDMQNIAKGFEGVPVDGEVIVYCACPNEAAEVKVARKLKRLGFKRVRPLHGGIDAWIEAGLEVEH